MIKFLQLNRMAAKAKKSILCIAFACFFVQAFAQTPPPIQWQVALGGSGYDLPSTIQQTSDGGYIVSGYSNSQDGDLSGSIHYGTGAAHNLWVVKLDGTGSIVWKKTYGIRDDDYQSISASIHQTADGGYILSGTATTWGQFSNYLVIKLDGTGNVQWTNSSLGGNAYDVGSSIWQTTDSGYAVAGSTSGNTAIHGGYDYYIVKLDPTGQNVQWSKALGGTGDDYGGTIQQVASGDYVMSGYTTSNDVDVSGNHGGTDGWLVGLDATGQTIQWQKALGGTGEDFIYSFQQNADGSYIVGGSTTSTDGDFSSATNYNGGGDAFVMKLDSNRNVVWTKYFGGAGADEVNEIRQTSDGGYTVACVKTNSTTGMDSWTLKLDGSGNIEWQKTLSGSNIDENYSTQKTSDNGYIMLMSTKSTDGDFTSAHGDNDYYVVKLLDKTVAPNACITWDLNADQSVTTSNGNIVGQPETISSGSSAPLMSVFGYNGGQKLWVGNTGWIAGAVDPLRYVEFNTSPTPGNVMNVNSVSFDYSDFPLGTDYNIIGFEVRYSTDNWSTSTQLGTTGFYLNTAVQTFSATLNATVNSGGTFSLRIYPYALQNGIAMTPTFAIHKNVMICGTTTVVLPSACITWDLNADQSVTTSNGNIVGQPETISSGSSAPLMSVFGYNGGQKLWVGNTGWIAGAVDPLRYVEFNTSPTPGNVMNVNSVSFDYSDFPLGTDYNIIGFEVRYSTDNWSTSTQLGTTGFYLNTAVQTFSATLNATVNSGGTFSLRIYPYALQNGIAMTPTFAIHKNVMICSTTAASAATGSICGSKFNDLNGNSIWDTGETGIAGWQINLNANDPNVPAATTVTDANGLYCFQNLPAGSYSVTEVQQPGWQQTAPFNPSFYANGIYYFYLGLADGQAATGFDFGNTFVGTGTQNACVNWSLVNSDAVTSTTGNVTAQTETISSGTAAPFMSVFGYVGGQQLWVGNTGWIAGAVDPLRYVEFNTSPTPGNILNVNSVSFDYSDFLLGTDYNIIGFEVRYSTDNWSSSTQLGTTGFYLNTAVHNFSATLNAAVNSGGTFSVRIFPYALQNGIAMTPTFAIHRNVLICGTTTVSLGTLTPDIQKVRIYPNPATGIVQVLLPERLYNQAIVAVYDQLGKKIMEVQAIKEQTTINFSSVQDGLYNLIITTASGQTIAKKLILMR